MPRPPSPSLSLSLSLSPFLSRRSPAPFAMFFAIVLAIPLLCVSEADCEEPKTSKFYDPLTVKVEGWTIKLDPQLKSDEHRKLGEDALRALANHLQRVKYIVPDERVKQLQKLPIWLERHNEKLGSMQYHPSRRWLIGNGHDPRLEKHVHIPRAAALLARSTWAKHPYVVLHELAHAYHDQVLSFDHPGVEAAYRQAKERELYEDVLLFTGRNVRHYALTNPKEFFAEMTETYFGVNDFYPFVRAELKQYDEPTYLMLQEIWGKVP